MVYPHDTVFLSNKEKKKLLINATIAWTSKAIMLKNKARYETIYPMILLIWNSRKQRTIEL